MTIHVEQIPGRPFGQRISTNGDGPRELPDLMAVHGGPPVELAMVLTNVRARLVTGEFIARLRVACGSLRPSSDTPRAFTVGSPLDWKTLNECTEAEIAAAYAATQRRCNDFVLPGSGLTAKSRVRDFLMRLQVAA